MGLGQLKIGDAFDRIIRGIRLHQGSIHENLPPVHQSGFYRHPDHPCKQRFKNVYSPALPRLRQHAVMRNAVVQVVP